VDFDWSPLPHITSDADWRVGVVLVNVLLYLTAVTIALNTVDSIRVRRARRNRDSVSRQVQEAQAVQAVEEVRPVEEAPSAEEAQVVEEQQAVEDVEPAEEPEPLEDPEPVEDAEAIEEPDLVPGLSDRQDD
jgi:hypothetical protein